MQASPNWVEDNAFIKRLLNLFVDQCDNPSTIRFQKSITPKSAPELFDFDHPDTQYLWPLIESKLHKEHEIIKRIQYKRVPINAEKYEKAIIYFNQQSEELVRAWLQRPARQSYALQWHAALDKFPQFRTSSLNQAIQVSSLSALELLAGFDRVEKELITLNESSEKISLRGLSARCFWGDSKFLDARRELLEHVFDLFKIVVIPRAIMLSAYIPLQLSELIFVENFDSFLSTVKAIKASTKYASTAVVYSAGYRGSAHLIRSLGHSQFVTMNSVENDVFKVFYDWWFLQSELNVKTYFWGDLDYEGVRILKALNNNFPNTKAWQLAYNLMLKYHHNGLGHSPKLANKQHQIQPEPSGCAYADRELTPQLIKSQRFLDQEVISQAQLLEQLSLTD